MKISSRQICFIMIAYTAATKLLMYPTLLSMASGNDLLFSALIDFFIGTAVIWSISFLCSRTDKTFFELIRVLWAKLPRALYSDFLRRFFCFLRCFRFLNRLDIYTIFSTTPFRRWACFCRSSCLRCMRPQKSLPT